MKIAELVKKTRIEANLTQEQFAEHLGTHANTVSRWESGTYDVPNKVVELLLEPKFEDIEVICPDCMGTGMVKKTVLKTKWSGGV